MPFANGIMEIHHGGWMGDVAEEEKRREEKRGELFGGFS